MSKKILLVEDDENLGSILKDFLELKNFEVTLSQDGEEGFKDFKGDDFDICVLDIMLPKKDGFTLAKEIRNLNGSVPIVFLTAKSLQNDVIEGLKLGADDYVTKPFSTEELILRINNILKRSGSSNGNSVNKDYLIGKFRFNYEQRILVDEKSETKLTSKESALLKMLCESKDEVLDRSEALKAIWKEDSYFTSRSMDVYITRLRSYLKTDESIKIINVHGEGFKLLVR